MENKKNFNNDFMKNNINVICGLWEEIIGDKIYPNVSLFEQGVDSLNATKFISILDKEYGVSMKLKLVFLNETVEKLASVLNYPLNKIENNIIEEGEI